MDETPVPHGRNERSQMSNLIQKIKAMFRVQTPEEREAEKALLRALDVMGL